MLFVNDTSDELIQREEHILCMIDDVLVLPDLMLLKKISNTKEIDSDLIDYRLIIDCDDDNLKYKIMKNPEKNILKYISKKEFKYEDVYHSLRTKYNLYDNNKLSKMYDALQVLLSQQFTKEITFIVNDDRQIKFLSNIFKDNGSKINILRKNIYDILKEQNNYTLIILNDVDIYKKLNDNKYNLDKKVFLISNMLYNHKHIKDDKYTVKYNYEDLMSATNNHIEFFDLFDINDSDSAVG